MPFDLAAFNPDAVASELMDRGYTVIPGVLDRGQVERFAKIIDDLMARERRNPPTPVGAPPMPNEDEIAAFYRKHYTVSEAEVERLLMRARETFRENLATLWPVPFNKVPKSFIHLPTMFDQDKSQRIWNLPNKAIDVCELIEHPVVLDVVRRILGEDCTLHDCEANSIGPKTGGGSWHVDAPLGQIPEPLPDFPLMVQNVWILDEFTAQNGATRVVPNSHKRRKSPPWGEGPLPDEVVLTAPVGSIAMWLSNTWHRSGPNETDKPRRVILTNYNRSWIRPFMDFTSTLDAEVAKKLSHQARYLLGFSARPPSLR